MAVISGRSWDTSCIYVWNNQDRLERMNKRSTVVTTIIFSPGAQPLLPPVTLGNPQRDLADTFLDFSNTCSSYFTEKGPGSPYGLGDCLVGKMGYSTVWAELQDREDNQYGWDSSPRKLKSRKNTLKFWLIKRASRRPQKVIDSSNVPLLLLILFRDCFYSIANACFKEMWINFEFSLKCHKTFLFSSRLFRNIRKEVHCFLCNEFFVFIKILPAY